MSGFSKAGDVMAEMPIVQEASTYIADRSETINELALALLHAQQALEPVAKDAQNPFFNSRYADLAACMDAAKKAFNANGIVIQQRNRDTDGTTICVETMLIHSSGQFLNSILRLKLMKFDPQAVGSAITYARRYALGVMTGLVTEEDDDGNAASQAQKDTFAPKAPAKSIGPQKTQSRPSKSSQPVHQEEPEDDRMWIQGASVGYLTKISKAPKPTSKGQSFGDMVFDMGEGNEPMTVTWFGFSKPWTFERLRDEVVNTGRAVFFTTIAPSNPKYKPTLEHISVQDVESDAAE